MKIDLKSKAGDKARLFIPLSEFSFAVYPVQVSPVFRHVSAATDSEIKPRNLRRKISTRAFQHFATLETQTTKNH